MYEPIITFIHGVVKLQEGMNVNRSDKYDVIVVGGGPAGSIAAITLARAEYNVLILDKKPRDLIGDKTCGDCLPPHVPRFLKKELSIKFPHDKEVEDVYKRVLLGTQEHHITWHTGKNFSGYILDRHIYGQRLLKEAEETGVHIIDNASVRELIIENNFVTGVKYFKNKEKKEAPASLVIDCSGAQAIVRKNLPDNFSYGLPRNVDDRYLCITYREIIEMREGYSHPWQEAILIHYHDDIPKPGYFWIFSKGPQKLNVGTGWLKSDDQDLDKPLKQLYRDTLHKYLDPKSYTVVKTGGGQLPTRLPFECLTFNGGVVCGDAGAMVDASNAEGHGPALRSGYYAARVADKALQSSDYSREGLWEYNTAIMYDVGQKSAIGWVGHMFLRDLSGSDINRIMSKNIHFGGNGILRSFKAILKQLIALFPRYGYVLLTLKYFLKRQKLVKHYRDYPRDPKKLDYWIMKRNKIIAEEM
ncbi:MAG: NAD(P)/FAD-dependent oxidoreductase [Candidatus Kariarchaeaceae archaeon]